jgi:carbamoyltransferase
VAVLGLAHDLFLSSAALVSEGRVQAAVAEERLSRRKLDKGFPARAVAECLRMGGRSLSDLAAVAVAWNPARHLEFPLHRLSNNARFRGEYLYAVPNMLLGQAGVPSGRWVEQAFDGLAPRLVYLDHHDAHAANAFFLSPWSDAAYLTADGRGEVATLTWGRASRERGIEREGETRFPHSLGMVYAAVTQHLGFRPDEDEWKVMALAATGTPRGASYQRLRALVEAEPEAMRLWVDQRHFAFASPEAAGGRFCTELFAERFGPPRVPGAAVETVHRDLARALQDVFEETLAALLCGLHRRTGHDRLVAGGGCFMNSAFNGRITRLTPFRQVFVSSCPDDAGTSVGAALMAEARLTGTASAALHRDNFWGPSYDEVIAETLQRFGLAHRRLEDPAGEAAELIAGGRLVGWFQGRMEFGQRALGHRSILADPRSPQSRLRLAAAVKQREEFRPFAPSVLAERVHEWFDVPATFRAPFMESVQPFREEVRARVPAVVHADGSGRVQTVEREDDPRFHDLLRRFDALTGVPLLLNTSFNVSGEPMVCTPADAVRTFFASGLDALVLGDRLLSK